MGEHRPLGNTTHPDVRKKHSTYWNHSMPLVGLYHQKPIWKVNSSRHCRLFVSKTKPFLFSEVWLLVVWHIWKLQRMWMVLEKTYKKTYKSFFAIFIHWRDIFGHFLERHTFLLLHFFSSSYDVRGHFLKLGNIWAAPPTSAVLPGHTCVWKSPW